jgi:hypothetical protein
MNVKIQITAPHSDSREYIHFTYVTQVHKKQYYSKSMGQSKTVTTSLVIKLIGSKA